MIDVALKPCPACGANATFFTDENRRIRCDGASACVSTKWCATTAEAVGIWNDLPRRLEYSRPLPVLNETWDPFERRNLAKDLLCAIAPRRGPKIDVGPGTFYQHPEPIKENVRLAVRYADSLLAELAKRKEGA